MIEKLENNEQILLMYLADELPAEDRAEVEQLLGSDASLRRELARLEDAHQTVERELALLDRLSMAPVSSDFAARSVGREIRQRLARPKLQPSDDQPQRQVRSWRWLYPTTAAAAILVCAMLWIDREATVSEPVATTEVTGNEARGPQPPTVVSVAPEPDSYALFVRSLRTTPDEDVQVVAQAGAADVMPQDDISQYLLESSSHGQ